jgi:hypothetical protein
VLDQENYSVAVRAHDNKTPIQVKGDLERIGQRWQLINARVVSVFSNGGEDEPPP